VTIKMRVCSDPHKSHVKILQEKKEVLRIK
jgi:hypothetical protein